MDLFSIISTVLDKFFPDANAKYDVEKARIAADLQKALIESQLMKNQTDINAEEAKHESVFVAGWRPFVGWVCGLAFAFNYVLLPTLTWFYVVIAGHAMPPMPEFDMVTLFTLLSGMLGMGALRSYDKKQNK